MFFLSFVLWVPQGIPQPAVAIAGGDQAHVDALDRDDIIRASGVVLATVPHCTKMYAE
jgi:hypothetical protein